MFHLFQGGICSFHVSFRGVWLWYAFAIRCPFTRQIRVSPPQAVGKLKHHLAGDFSCSKPAEDFPYPITGLEALDLFQHVPAILGVGPSFQCIFVVGRYWVAKTNQQGSHLVLAYIFNGLRCQLSYFWVPHLLPRPLGPKSQRFSKVLESANQVPGEGVWRFVFFFLGGFGGICIYIYGTMTARSAAFGRTPHAPPSCHLDKA